MNEKQSLEEIHVDELLWVMLQHQAHELHLEVGREPWLRHDGKGEAREMDGYEACKPQNIQSMVYDIISDEQIQAFENDLVLAFEHRMRLSDGERNFNGLAVRDQGNIAASFRLALG